MSNKTPTVLEPQIIQSFPKIGAPRKFDTVEELEEQINKYFQDCQTFNLHPTISGLAVALDTTRRTLIDYEEFKDSNLKSFAHTLKKAKAFIESYKHQLLLDKDRPAGVIFDLKNNHGWKDQIDINQNTKKETVFRIEFSDSEE